MTELLSQYVKSALMNKAKLGSKTRVNIPNDHPYMAQDAAKLEAIAKALGIDWEATKYTFNVVVKGADRSVYQPYVEAKNGVAVLSWGETKTPLADLKAQFSIEGDKKSYLEAFVSFEYAGETVDCMLNLNLMIGEDYKADPHKNKKGVDKATLKAALRNGTLGKYLSEGFQKPMSLSELADGEYQVTGYNISYFQGQPKVDIVVNGKRYKANTSLSNRILASITYNEAGNITDKLEVSPDKPATLVLYNTGKTTSTGFAIMSANLITAEDDDIPEYDFDTDDVLELAV